jgi:hypothetical protein
MTSFRATVSAIGYSIIRERCGSSGTGAAFPHNRVVRFLLEQHDRMAGHLRLALMLVALAFDWSSLPRHGQPFHTLPHCDRWRQLEAWRRSPLGTCRKFVQFFESLVLFYWYSEVDTATTAVTAVRGAGRTAA